MATPHWRLILNGKATDNADLREAVRLLRERGIRLEVRVTWEDGDAERYVGEAVADGVHTVVAAGGDGTLRTVAAALAHRDGDAGALPSLGLVPLGTANDFAKAANIPIAPLDALTLIAACAAQPVDLLRIDAEHGPHWCANVASGGFGTQVTVETDEGLKKMLGGLAYLITGMSRLGRIDPISAHFSGPDFSWESTFIALGLGNGRQAGGGQVLCPEALIDDGLLDVTIVPDLDGEVTAMLGTLITGGKQAALERVAVRARVPWLEIVSQQPLTLNLDGEPETSQHFRIDCIPARLRMHLPDDCALLLATNRKNHLSRSSPSRLRRR